MSTSRGFDWLGQFISHSHEVVEEIWNPEPGGERLWGIRCAQCFRRYLSFTSQLNNPQGCRCDRWSR